MIGGLNLKGSGTDTSDATAIASEILSGKTAYVNDTKITGTMTNKGAISKTLSAGEDYTIPEGYHNGEGTVSAKTLSEQTQATAAASDIQSGKTAYVNGAKVTGTSNAVNINGIIEQYKVAAGETIASGDFVNYQEKIVQDLIFSLPARKSYSNSPIR